MSDRRLPPARRVLMLRINATAFPRQMVQIASHQDREDFEHDHTLRAPHSEVENLIDN